VTAGSTKGTLSDSTQKGRGTKSLIHPMGEVAWVDEIESERPVVISGGNFRNKRWPIQIIESLNLALSNW
jgi:hypothetical protein